MANINKDCFGYNNSTDNGCKVLKVLECKKKECPFFKTKEQYIKDKVRYEVADGTERPDGQLTGQLSINDI